MERVSDVGDQLGRQAAAVPFRTSERGVEILVIRRRGKPWGIPKGNVEVDETVRETALKEAREEAGVEGELLEEELGQFSYQKNRRVLLVRVFAMKVTKIDDHYPEESLRERRWVSVEQALDMIGRREIQPLIAKLGRIVLT
jgi:8-oxo-dGTP pyrophosphatase MutT (NUDIX family)